MNRLVNEKSPYLQQHAHNPVDWYPWGDEAIARARTEDRPIFLSVGYSTCHWCHVMERESFEDPSTAALLNDNFVNIKVDREERPDLDRVYMAFVQAATGGGGWPMSVWLTPELKPFFGGTYFPPTGFPSLLQELSSAWRSRRDELVSASDRVVAHLEAMVNNHGRPDLLDDGVQDHAFTLLSSSFDERHGGFGGAPKFPRPVVLHFLLRYLLRSKRERAGEMVLSTLRAMARGGIHDHLGGGFHRYSVDARWHVPHFEKMLYDQAQLATAYLEAFDVDGDAELAATAEDIFAYVQRELTDAATGAFYSAEDADSEDEQGDRKEGAFYVWTAEELAEVAGDSAALFCEHYGVEPAGNAQDPHGELLGKNVLSVQAESKLDEADEQLATARSALFARQAKRPRPHLDDKVITSWNGLMISAFVRGYRRLDKQRYLQAAQRAATFAMTTLFDEGERKLFRRYREGQRAFEGNLEDYAALITALVDLYEADFDVKWLQGAEQLTEIAIERFADAEQGGFFASVADDASVLLRIKDDYDGAEPSGNSLMAVCLLRLGVMIGRPDFAQLAAGTIRLFSARLRRAPEVMPLMLAAADLQQHDLPLLVISGERDAPAVERLLGVARRRLLPDRATMLADSALIAAYGERLPNVVAMGKDGSAKAYLCRGQHCEAPIDDPARLEQALL